MRSPLVILALLFLFSCRNIEGSYYESFGIGWGGATYDFHKNGTFEYESHYDVGGEYGNGIYSIRGGRITMKFTTQTDSVIPGIKFVAHVRDSASDSSRMVVYVNDETNYGMPGAVVMFQSLRDSLRYGAVTDFDGKVKLVLAENDDSMMITIRYVGYHKIEQKISVRQMDTITFQLQVNGRGWHSPVDSGRVWKYRIRHVKGDTMVLKKREWREFEMDDYRVKRRWMKKVIRLEKTNNYSVRALHNSQRVMKFRPKFVLPT